MLSRSRFFAVQRKLFCFNFSTEVPHSKKASRRDDIRRKISNSTFLKYELSQNPEFDKAFPHLAKYKPATKITRHTSEYDFIESLTYHKRVPEEKSFEDTIEENSKRYLEGYSKPNGPIQWMSEEDKEKVHNEVNVKMQELEDTGLSRDELLYSDRVGGTPLAMDPFFQFLKRNKLAREILFKPAEEFTVVKVVELALRQDIGLDPALSRRHKQYLYDHQVDDATLYNLARNKVEDRQVFDPNAYFAEQHNEINMSKEILADQNRKYFKMPKTRGQAKKELSRKIDLLDVHWRNTEFLTKFLGESGKIKNKYQNRLPKDEQRLIAKTVKHARQLAMLPYTGYIKPTDKKSLTSLQEDIQDFCKKKINIETGHIYVDTPGEDMPSEDPYIVKDPMAYDKEGRENLKSIDLEFMPIMPNNEEVKILEAQHYATKLKLDELKKRGIDIDKLKILRANGIRNNSFQPVDIEPETNLEEQDLSKFSQSFENFKENVKGLPVEKFIRTYIAEKAVKGQELYWRQDVKTTASESKTKEELLSNIAQIKRELGVE